MSDNEKQEKFLALFDPISDKLFMYALALEKDRDNAQDLVSDTILACYERFESLRDTEGFKGYAFKTARSIFRRKYSRLRIFTKWDERQSDSLSANLIQPDLPIDIDFLYQALDELPEKQKEVVVLFEISGFSLNEICQIQGSSLSAVKSRAKRGREKLAELLRDNESQNENKYNFHKNAMLIQ